MAAGPYKGGLNLCNVLNVQCLMCDALASSVVPVVLHCSTQHFFAGMMLRISWNTVVTASSTIMW